jgi:hypothetical protein
MSVRAGLRLFLIGVIFAAFAVPASAHAPSHPQIGRYKASTSVGTSFEFRVVKATCPPPVRGGNQHQKRGFCLLPLGEPTFDYTCPSGFTIHGEIYALFEELLSASGKLVEPETSSSGTTGTFHISVDRSGHATGFFEIVALHAIEGSETLEKCPTGRMTFSAKRV